MGVYHARNFTRGALHGELLPRRAEGIFGKGVEKEKREPRRERRAAYILYPHCIFALPVPPSHPSIPLQPFDRTPERYQSVGYLAFNENELVTILLETRTPSDGAYTPRESEQGKLWVGPKVENSIGRTGACQSSGPRWVFCKFLD